MDADGNINVMLLVALILAGLYNARRQPCIQHDSVLTGALYYQEIMDTQNVNRFRAVAKMDKATFDLLKTNLIDGGLSDSMFICCWQKILIFLYILRGHTNRETAERWQHSGATISEIVHEVSDCLDNIQHRIFKPAKYGDPVPTKIANNANFSPFFDNCIGALDGTHIPAIIPLELQGPFSCKLNNCGMRRHNDDRLHDDRLHKVYLMGFTSQVLLCSVEVSGTRDEASCCTFIF